MIWLMRKFPRVPNRAHMYLTTRLLMSHSSRSTVTRSTNLTRHLWHTLSSKPARLLWLTQTHGLVRRCRRTILHTLTSSPDTLPSRLRTSRISAPLRTSRSSSTTKSTRCSGRPAHPRVTMRMFCSERTRSIVRATSIRTRSSTTPRLSSSFRLCGAPSPNCNTTASLN